MIVQKIILEPELQNRMFKASLIRIIRLFEKEDPFKIENVKNFKTIFDLGCDSLMRYNILTYGLSFTLILLLSDKYAKIQNDDLFPEYIRVMENQKFWVDSFNNPENDFSIEPYIIFVFKFLLSVYPELYIDFELLNEVEGDEVKEVLRDIIKKIEIDYQKRVVEWMYENKKRS